MKMYMKKWKASYTVEASFMVPLLIATMVIAIKLGISCFTEVQEQTEQERICQLWEVKNFYRYQILKEIADD